VLSEDAVWKGVLPGRAIRLLEAFSCSGTQFWGPAHFFYDMGCAAQLVAQATSPFTPHMPAKDS